MQFEIKRAELRDVAELSCIMEAVAARMEQPAWFMQDDRAYIEAHIGERPLSGTDKGFILKVLAYGEGNNFRSRSIPKLEPITDPETAGFFMVHFPGLSEENLGRDIGLSVEKQALVAHMDSVVILPEYRGHGLQHMLMKEAERIIKSETGYRILMATVHPDNTYSLRNVKAHGYEVAAKAIKYGGHPRYILKKEI